MTQTFRRADAASARATTSARLLAACGSAALVVSLAGPAHADLTAQTAREEFEEYYETMGAAVEVGSEQAGSGRVTLSDVTFDLIPAPEEGEPAPSFELTMDEILFEEQGDGSVLATVSPSGRATFRNTDIYTDAETVVSMRVETEGLQVRVSEAGAAADGDGADASQDGRRYENSAQRIALILEGSTTGGRPEDVEGEFVMTGLSGTTMAGPMGDTTRYEADSGAEEMRLELDLPAGAEQGSGFPPPSDDGGTAADDEPLSGGDAGRLALSFTFSDVAMEGTTDLPADMTAVSMSQDMGALLDAGFTLDADLTYGVSGYAMSQSGGQAAGSDFSFESSGESGRLGVVMSREEVGYDLGGRGIRYVYTGSGSPVERIEVGLEETDFAVRLPAGATEEARPVVLRMMFGGLTLNEEVWALFDPEARLPRDPANFMLTLDGQARLAAGLFDTEAQEELAMTGEEPGEVERADVEMSFDALGASISADGSFTFDNDDLETFGGFPAPTGRIVIEALGIDALLDTVTDMGLVPPDQLMPARMMLGLFARPDDSGGYTSEIEVDGATGSVTANGQRLR